MEQIKNGMLKLAKFISSGQMTIGRPEIGETTGESEFGKLLEQKNTEVRTETAAERKDTTDSTRETEQKPTASKKTESGREEESCDVAREAACAQMVWLVPQEIAQEQSVVQEVTVEAVVGEMTEAVAEMGEGVPVQKTVQELAPQTPMMQETSETAETALPVEQTVTAAEGSMQTENGGNSATQFTGNDESEVKVKVENDETGGEAAAVEAPLFKDVEAAPIKVAEAPAETRASDVENQISEKLTGAFENGESRVEIQLTPEALGKVTVELIRGADGTLNILLSAENQETRELLGKHIGALQEAIVDRGQQNVQIEVNRGEEAQQQQNQNQDLKDGHNGSNARQQRRQEESSGDDFLQQLRLGLIDVEES